VAELGATIVNHINKMKGLGLVEAPIYFNQFQTMTAGELLIDMLNFYPSSEKASHKLTDAEELQISHYFQEVCTLLESHRPEKGKVNISRDLTKELNVFFEHIDQVFIQLFGRDSSNFVFDGHYFDNQLIRDLFTDSVVDLLRGDRP